MTREQAINELREMKTDPWTDNVQMEALDTAINSLKVDEKYDIAMENAEPLITRDDVIYAIKACGCLYHIGKTWYEEKELIQCFDDLYFNDKHIGGNAE